MAFDHYVQRAFLKKWTAGTDGRERKDAWVFDFPTCTLKKEPLKTLFAVPDLHPDNVDNRLKKLVETPLADFNHSVLTKRRLRTQAGMEQAREMELRPPARRALALALHAQVARFSDAKNTKLDPGTTNLGKLLLSDEATLNFVVEDFYASFKVGMHILPTDMFMFQPETGFFAFPLLEAQAGCPTGWSYGFAIPTSPTTAHIAVSHTAILEANDLTNSLLAMMSTGLADACARVVVPTSIVEALGEKKVAQLIQTSRMEAQDVMKNVQAMRDLARDMWNRTGFALVRDSSWTDRQKLEDAEAEGLRKDRGQGGNRGT